MMEKNLPKDTKVQKTRERFQQSYALSYANDCSNKWWNVLVRMLLPQLTNYRMRARERLNDFTILLEILMPLKKIA